MSHTPLHVREKRDPALDKWGSFLTTLKTLFPCTGELTEEYKRLSELDPTGKGFKSALEEGVSCLAGGASRQRMSVAASCFLYRKTLPSTGSVKDAEQAFVKKMGSTGIPAGASWEATAEEVVLRLFPQGWDNRYGEFCLLARTNATASLAKGVSARKTVEGDMSSEEFFRACLDGDGLRGLDRSRRVVGLDDGGKIRVVTVADAFQSQLLPLHLCMYDSLSRNPWLLRGDASRSSVGERLDGVEVTPGGVFVSGDYESATDNFVPFNSERLVALVSKTSVNIPKSVWGLALGRFEAGPLNTSSGISGTRRMGQLMGDYLSFPLLCLTNFVGFIHALGPRGWEIAETGFLLINGDDIVFYATPSEGETWMDSVGSSGLVLSKGKTLVHRCFFSINSTFFIGSSRRGENSSRVLRTHLLPVIRWRTWVTPGSSGVYGRALRVYTDGAGRGREFLKSFVRKLFGLMRSKGVPTGLAGALWERNAVAGVVPPEFKERVSWYRNWSAVLPVEAGNGPGRAVGGGEWVSVKRAALKGVRRSFPKYGELYTLEEEWGVINLERTSRRDRLETWGDTIPRFVLPKTVVPGDRLWSFLWYAIRERENPERCLKGGLGQLYRDLSRCSHRLDAESGRHLLQPTLPASREPVSSGMGLRRFKPGVGVGYSKSKALVEALVPEGKMALFRADPCFVKAG